MKIVISACLLGVRCRYDGGDSRNETAIKQGEQYALIPVCPEESGGLPTPASRLQRLSVVMVVMS